MSDLLGTQLRGISEEDLHSVFAQSTHVVVIKPSDASRVGSGLPCHR